MNRRAAVALAVIVGLVAVSTPIAISIYLARKQSFDEQMEHVTSIARDVLRRSDQTTNQIFAVFDELEAARDPDPCSDENIRLMGKLDLASEQVQAVGYVANDTLLCSSYGRHETPVGPTTYSTTYGALVRTGLEFPVLPGRKFLVVTHNKTGYTVAIHPNLPLDVFVDEPDVSVGVYSFPSKGLIIGRGLFDPRWIDRLGAGVAVRFADDKSLVSIQRSDRYAYAAIAAVPRVLVDRELRRAALVLLPIGIFAGLVLALAVLYVARQQLALPAVLKTALKRNEFFLNYQPIVDLNTGQWVGAEALIRWQRANGEMVRPDVFIAAAEETGLIQRITERVMKLAGDDARQIFRRYPDFHIAINLSAADLQSRATIEDLRWLTDQTAAKGDNIMVEATERGFIRADMALEILHEIREMGIQIAIDDFGTGYSSLAYLESFKLDYLKIDKSFIDTLGKDAATSQVVPHIIEMAKALKLKMIAEGVETEAQAEYLRAQGVQFAQGWLYARPMTFAQLTTALATDGTRPASPSANST